MSEDEYREEQLRRVRGRLESSRKMITEGRHWGATWQITSALIALVGIARGLE